MFWTLVLNSYVKHLRKKIMFFTLGNVKLLLFSVKREFIMVWGLVLLFILEDNLLCYEYFAGYEAPNLRYVLLLNFSLELSNTF